MLTGWTTFQADPGGGANPFEGVYVYSTGYVENNMGGSGFVEFRAVDGNQHVDLTSYGSGHRMGISQEVKVEDGAEYTLSLALGNAAGKYTTYGGDIVDQYSEAARIRIVVTSENGETLYDAIFENNLCTMGKISWSRIQLAFKAKGTRVRVAIMAANPTDEYVGIDDARLDGPGAPEPGDPPFGPNPGDPPDIGGTIGELPEVRSGWMFAVGLLGIAAGLRSGMKVAS